MNNFSTWWDFCQLPQNDGSANDATADQAPNATRWGWTFPTYITARNYAGQDATIEEFMAMTQAQAGVLAHLFFWNRMGGSLASGPDVVMVDWAWTSGHAVALAQYNMGMRNADIDGLVGPYTAHVAVHYGPPLKFVNDCTNWRTGYYDKLGFRDKYPGLYTRAAAAHTLGLSLIS